MAATFVSCRGNNRQLRDALSGAFQPQSCKRKCKFNRGAILTLFLSFCGFAIFNVLLTEEHTRKHTVLVVHNKSVSPLEVLIMCMLLYPVFSWLADVRYGRLKVIKWSFRVMLVTLIVFCIASAVGLSSRIKHRGIRNFLKVGLYAALSLGLGGFLANIVQFSIEQLTDASSDDILSYIHWYAWIWFLSGGLVDASLSCLCSNYHQQALGYLVLPVLITLAICSEVLFKHWLVEEPIPGNPFALIFNVLRYAIKNKHPRVRSAFTYWDEKDYRRIDLAKMKYGGPFTTEQVEDVKTFFRMASVILAGAFFVGLYINVYSAYNTLFYRLNGTQFDEKKCDYSHAYLSMCFQWYTVFYSGHMSMIIAIPVLNIVVYPLFARYFQVSILKKVMVGAIFFFLSLASSVAIEFAAQYIHAQQHPNITSVSCPLGMKFKNVETLSLDYKWMLFPYSLNTLALYIFITSIVKFMCAQSPYSMKGLIFGLMYGSAGFFTIVGYPIVLLIQLIAKKIVPFGCMLWYLVISSVVLVGILALVLIVFKCYKRRAREYVDNRDE